MADLFLSYARADRGRIELLAAALTAEGYSVWWDRDLTGGGEFSKEIEKELNDAKAVIVAWSSNGSDSPWVRDEASMARKMEKLFPVRLDETGPPLGFQQYHTFNFSGWKGEKNHEAFLALLKTLNHKIPSKKNVIGQSIESNISKPHKTQNRFKSPALIAGITALAVIFVGSALLSMRGNDIASVNPSSQVTQVAESPNQTVAQEQSIAVLPFDALSDDASDEYFGKGIAEELLNELAKFPELKVAARTSAFSFEGGNVDIREIGKQLGVAHILEGSVRRSGQRVRVTAQLVRTLDGFQFWSKTYDREFSNIFSIEDEIVHDITRSLEIRLGVGAGLGRASSKGVDPQAYEQYLKGLTLWGERARKNSNRPEALKAFELATQLDPDFSAAWASLGNAYAYSNPTPLGLDPEPFHEQTDRALAKALELDPDNAVAHSALAVVKANQAVDITGSRMHIERALAISPNRAETHYAAGHYWRAIGNVDQAVQAFDRAISLDPLNIIFQSSRSLYLASIGRFEEAFIFLDSCREQDCLAEGFYSFGVAAAIMSGDDERIAVWAQKFEELEASVRQLPPNFMPEPMYAMPSFVAIEARSDDAGAKLTELLARLEIHPIAEDISIWGPSIAEMMPADEFVELLHYAYERRQLFTSLMSFAPYHNIHPYPEEVLRHPRYHVLWQRDGMPELAEARRANGWEDGLPLPIEKLQE